MSKPRQTQLSDLTEEQKAQLQKWLFDENITYSKARSLCQSEFGLEVKVDALFRWRREVEKHQLADRALNKALQRASESALTASALIHAAEEMKDPFWQALMNQLGQDAFETRMKGETPDLPTIEKLAEIASFGLKAKYDAAKVAQGQQKLEQSDRRIKLLEEREAKTKEVVSNADMSAEDKEKAVKQILGIS